MYTSDVRDNVNLLEYGKFVRIDNDVRFPAISVTRTAPNSTDLHPITSMDVYPKYGLITYLANPSDINISLSASNVDIGDVGIIDHTTGNDVHIQIIETATVNGYRVGSLKVKTQDYPQLDSLTAKDFATETTLKALTGVTYNTKITSTAPVSGSVTVLNQVSSVSATIINPITAISISNPTTSVSAVITNTPAVSGSITVLNQVSSVSATITNPVTAVTVSTNGNTLAVSGSVTVTNTLSATLPGTVNVSYADGYQIDQTGRLRVATIGQQWWYTSAVDKDGDLRMIESFVAPASSIFIQNYAATLMTSGSASTGSAIRASRRRFPVRPGTSQQWFGILNWDGNDLGVVKRKGWFTSFNGMFFELSGGDMNVVVRRRLPDGTLNESRVSRNDFNGDKLNGSGPSGENWNTTLSAYTTNTLTPTVTAVAVQNALSSYNVAYKVTTAASASAFTIGSKVTVHGMSPITFNGCAVVQSYSTALSTITLTYPFNPGTYSSGVGSGSITQNAFHGTHTYFFDTFGGRTNRVRFGKVTDNGEVILHTFKFDGQFGGCYASAPAMPVRKEIYNTQNVNLLPSMTVFGTSLNVESEAELNPGFGVARNNTPINCTLNNEVPVLGLGIRVGEPYQRADIQVQSIGISDLANPNGKNASNSILYWRLLLNPGLSGVPSSTDIGKASRQWAYNTSGLTTSLTGGPNGGGIELLAGYATSGDTISVGTSLNFLNLGSNITYTDSDKIVLMVGVLAAGGTATSTIVGTMNFIEAL